MHFRQAKARNFRLLKDLKLDLHPKLNYVVGDNGAGKSTILEALFVLGRAHSHRGSSQRLVSDRETAWSLEANLQPEQSAAPDNTIRVRWSERRLSLQIDDRTVGLAELVRTVPVLLLDPLSHRLMEEGPGIRRRYIDWGVFHMEHDFHAIWVRMNQALRQRNAALRAFAKPAELKPWNLQLAQSAELLTQMRRRYVDLLQETISPYWQCLLGETAWTLRFHPGWRSEFDYAALLESNYETERKLGYTKEGPHRAELQILSDNSALEDRISRGQQKLLIAAMVLAQCELYRVRHGVAPILLVDDFSAELSQTSQARLLQQLEAYSGQKIVAALEYGDLFKSSTNHSVFHVEHGQLTTTQ